MMMALVYPYDHGDLGVLLDNGSESCLREI